MVPPLTKLTRVMLDAYCCAGVEGMVGHVHPWHTQVLGQGGLIEAAAVEDLGVLVGGWVGRWVGGRVGGWVVAWMDGAQLWRMGRQ
jgi:hypothetical protein